MPKFDVIVVGSGHAGLEAALASARMGASCLMVTMNADQIATMSCNPAIGGLGKSQLAREVDVFGGAMAEIADLSAMQYRILNEKKGPAVRATRIQVDRHEYRARMKYLSECQDFLQLAQAQIAKLIFEGGRLVGVSSQTGQNFYARAVIVTTGTFMNGKAHIGRQNFSTGRAGEAASIGLSDFLRSSGVKIGRFKTGTVPRVDSRSIDYSKTEIQGSHEECSPLSLFSNQKREDLVSAHLSFTNSKTHEIIRSHLSESPLYSGLIEGRGPRYCPSVEDKVVKFGDKDRHQIFLEREGRMTNEVYVGGLSTSLPYECQLEFLRSIEGLENVQIVRPGYAIEYDYIDATQLKPNLEMKDFPGLFFAGQVNGTSGYEEAAAQGILAGINATLFVREQDPLILSRAEAYARVLVDDLTSIPITEPYRMLSSRAEWRLLLREDNVDERLFVRAEKLNLLSDQKRAHLEEKLSRRQRAEEKVSNQWLHAKEELNALIRELDETPLKYSQPLKDFIRRPRFGAAALQKIVPELYSELSANEWEAVISKIKYEGYLRQSQAQIHQLERMESVRVPTAFDFSAVKGLTKEASEKLSALRPINLSQVSRVEGITPATLSLLAIHLSKRKTKSAPQNVSCVERRVFD